MKQPSDIQQTFPVLEMTCAACAVSVASMLQSIDGVKEASVNYANQNASVLYNPELVTPEMMQKTIRDIGYDIIIEQKNQEAIKEEAQQKQYQAIKTRTIWSSILSTPVVIIGMFFMNMPYANWIMMILATPVVFYFGRNFFINTIKQARHGRANMDTLVALSTSIAYLFSVFNTLNPEFWHRRGLHAHVYFEAASVIIAFISLGKLLEEKAKANTSSAIKKLIGLQPKTVHIIVDGQEKQIAIDLVKVNDILVVKPGERIPVDGEVITGSSFVDESMISGESFPVNKNIKSPVFAGTINQKGSFQFRADKVGGDTVLAHIIKMVQQAQGSKAPVQKLADKIAGIFVPVVMAIALLTFLVWMVAGGEQALTHALLTATTVLVIACPCALGLATPTAIMVGIGKGAEQGILIKDAESLELGYKTNVIILDKTGTITEGHPEVTAIKWADNNESERNAQLLFSMESKSEHPLADAIVRYLTGKNTQQIELTSFESITGQGIEAVYDGTTYYTGSSHMMEQNNIPIPEEMRAIAEQWYEAASTVIWFANATKVLAAVAIADKIKPSSAAAIARLQEMKIEVYMITGDNEHTAKSVAEKVGIKQYRAETLPTDKAEFVKKLQNDGKIVAMVGDGINDSQALAQADVSIAMGKGSDIAIDIAKMTLISSDLNSIPNALRLSRNTVRTIRQNLFWAFIYNLIGIPLAAGVLYPVNGFLLNPMIAGGAMALSSVSVVANSLRLKYIK